MEPFAGQYADPQHNAMDKVLRQAVDNFYKERGRGISRNHEQALRAFMRGEPIASLSASLTSAMEALGLELTTKPARATT